MMVLGAKNKAVTGCNASWSSRNSVCRPFEAQHYQDL